MRQKLLLLLFFISCFACYSQVTSYTDGIIETEPISQYTNNIQYYFGLSHRRLDGYKNFNGFDPNTYATEFSKILGKNINKDETPKTYEMMRYLLYEASEVSLDYYSDMIKCIMGWLYAYVFVEGHPSKYYDLMKVGYAFGEKSVYYGYTFESDRYEGMLMASIMYTLIRYNNDFMERYNGYKEEFPFEPKQDKIPSTSDFKSYLFLDGPPDENSYKFVIDIHQYIESFNENETTERGKQVISDIQYQGDYQCEIYNDILGIPMSKDITPNIYKLINSTIRPCSHACYVTKGKYLRTRPFAYYNENALYIPHQSELDPHSSYPSGHSSISWGIGLALSEIAPDKYKSILKRAYDFGQSRVIGRYHWQSDVNDGRIIASSIFAYLHSAKEYLELIELAKKEYQTATSITTLKNTTYNSNGIYSLSGIRLNKEPNKGIFISNGKKKIR